jgi:hypothetical protein
MHDFADAALEALKDLLVKKSAIHERKNAIPLASRILEVLMSFFPDLIDPVIHKENTDIPFAIQVREFLLPLFPTSTACWNPNITSIVRKMEKEFIDEVSALYYLNLVRIEDLISLFLKADNKKPLIRGWLSNWIEDLVTLQKGTFQNILTRLRELGLYSGSIV